MFHKISKKKESIHTDYSLLEKICCRDYDNLKPIQIPDDIGGELANSSSKTFDSVYNV